MGNIGGGGRSMGGGGGGRYAGPGPSMGSARSFNRGPGNRGSASFNSGSGPSGRAISRGAEGRRGPDGRGPRMAWKDGKGHDHGGRRHHRGRYFAAAPYFYDTYGYDYGYGGGCGWLYRRAVETGSPTGGAVTRTASTKTI